LDCERAGAAGHLAVYHLMPRQHFAGERPVQRGEADDLVALRAPAAEQRLEQARELTALELGVRGEDMCRDRISLAADQLVERRQRGRNLHAAHRLAVP